LLISQLLDDNDDDNCDQRRKKKILSVPAFSKIFFPMLNVLCSKIRIIQSRRMRWAGHVARMEEKRNSYRLLVGMPEGKRPLGRPRGRWLDNIRMDLVEVGGVMWTGLVWLRIGTGGELL
jgi:hypothetical protein